MPQLGQRIPHIALVGVLALLTGLSGCKYTGGDDEQPADEQQASSTESEQPASEASDEQQAQQDQQDQQKILSLGEGSEEQRELIARAKKAFLTNDLETAEKLFSELAKTRPVSGPQVSAVIALAQIYNETDRPQKALELYNGLEERVEDVPEVQLVIARAFAEQGQTERAVAGYKKLLETQPDFVFAWIELAELHGEAGDKEKASKALYRYEKRVYSMAKKLENPETSAADRINILDVFSLVNDDRAIKAVVEVLRADEPAVRQKAATVLGEIGAPEAKPSLELVAARDQHPGVRTAAKNALEQIRKAGDARDTQLGPRVVEDKDQLPQ